jgi:adenylate kinase
MNYVLLGPPGAGKGTQAKKLVERFSLVHLSTGDIFREAKKSDRVINELLTSGQLVPDTVVVNMMKKHFEGEYIKKGFLLDGFPRTVRQAEELDVILKSEDIKIDAVFFINVHFSEAIRRISGRRVCSSCGASYHISDLASKEGPKCTVCFGVLIQRNDDKEDIVKDRFSVYEKQTKPLIEYYNKIGLLINIDGFKNEFSVFRQICESIKV